MNIRQFILLVIIIVGALTGGIWGAIGAIILSYLSWAIFIAD
jgi:hypothetical protein